MIEYIIRLDGDDIVCERRRDGDFAEIARTQPARATMAGHVEALLELRLAAQRHAGTTLPWIATEDESDQWLLRTGDVSTLPPFEVTPDTYAIVFGRE